MVARRKAELGEDEQRRLDQGWSGDETGKVEVRSALSGLGSSSGAVILVLRNWESPPPAPARSLTLQWSIRKRSYQ